MATYAFSVLSETYAVVRLPPDASVPAWALAARGFSSLTRTGEELSVVCPEADAPRDTRMERGWAALKLHGPFPFTQVGVLASVAAPLAQAGISIFAVSTFDTDYILVPAARLQPALAALRSAGHTQLA
jgi:hypothetical protein